MLFIQEINMDSQVIYKAMVHIPKAIKDMVKVLEALGSPMDSTLEDLAKDKVLDTAVVKDLHQGKVLDPTTGKDLAKDSTVGIIKEDIKHMATRLKNSTLWKSQ